MNSLVHLEHFLTPIKLNDYLLQNSTFIGTKKEDTSIKLSASIAYMIGYYIGNGSMSQYIDNRGGNKLEKYRIRFHSGRKEPLEYIRQGLFSNFNIKLAAVYDKFEAVQHIQVTSDIFIWATIYSLVYSSFILFIAAIIFNKRNL